MIEELFNLLSEGLSGLPHIALAASFFWGVLSILLSPCHLSGIPLIIGFIASQQQTGTGKSALSAVLFALGNLVTIAAIGLITSMLGRLLGDIGSTGIWLVAALLLLVGLHLTDLLTIPWNSFLHKIPVTGSKYSALLLGLVFGLAVGPCTFAFIAPVLGAVFQLTTTNSLLALMLLLSFAIGHCSVMVLAGTLAGAVQKYLNWTGSSPVVTWLKRLCGVLVMCSAVYIVYSYYL